MSKVILISESGYHPKYDELLKNLINQRINLFCAVGKDCELWEEMMDELAVGDGAEPVFITTSSHPNDSVKEVMEFAKSFKTESETEVQLVRI